MTPPTKTPPKKTLRNSGIIGKIVFTEKFADNANASKMLNNTMAVASLKSDSPSTKSINRLGTPNSLNKATTATGSVADIKAPNNKAIIKLISRENHNPKPTNIIEKIIPGMAKTKIGSKFLSKPRASRDNADSKIKAGKKTKTTNSCVR